MAYFLIIASILLLTSCSTFEQEVIIEEYDYYDFERVKAEGIGVFTEDVVPTAQVAKKLADIYLSEVTSRDITEFEKVYISFDEKILFGKLIIL